MPSRTAFPTLTRTYSPAMAEESKEAEDEAAKEAEELFEIRMLGQRSGQCFTLCYMRLP
jgi:hypothetical protein